MIRSMNPYRTAVFNRSVIIVPLETEQQKRQRENQDILDGFTREHREQFARECRAARYGILGAILTWSFIAWLAWRIW